VSFPLDPASAPFPGERRAHRGRFDSPDTGDGDLRGLRAVIVSALHEAIECVAPAGVREGPVGCPGGHRGGRSGDAAAFRYRTTCSSAGRDGDRAVDISTRWRSWVPVPGGARRDCKDALDSVTMGPSASPTRSTCSTSVQNGPPTRRQGRSRGSMRHRTAWTVRGPDPRPFDHHPGSGSTFHHAYHPPQVPPLTPHFSRAASPPGAFWILATCELATCDLRSDFRSGAVRVPTELEWTGPTGAIKAQARNATCRTRASRKSQVEGRPPVASDLRISYGSRGGIPSFSRYLSRAGGDVQSALPEDS